jgi:hypothetical protein
MSDNIWYRDLRVLFGPRWYEFWPTVDQTFSERINAMTRFVIYATILMYIVRRNPTHVLVGLAIVAVLAFIHRGQGGGDVEAFSDDNGSGGLDDVIFSDFTAPEKPGVPPQPNNGCIRPTTDNPFGNVLLTDMTDNPGRPAVCPYNDIENEIKSKFNERLYRNVNDIYEKENSQRQFYSMPVTSIPNDVETYREFVFGIKKNCKTNPKDCTGY